MGLKKLNRWMKSKIHGYDLPQLVKSKPWVIKPTDRICILAPHPDDETIACGGLLAKYGSQCDVVLLTNGQKGGLIGWSEAQTAEVRKSEFEKAMAFLNVRSYSFMNGMDSALIDAYQAFAQIDFSTYDYVLMPHRQDTHADHMVVSAFWKRLVKEKKFKARAVYYELWGALSVPTHYMDISDVIEQKKEAIAFYQSQLANIDYTSRIVALNHYRGIHHHILYEEDFAMERA